ncbi:MAG: hypothetical protein DRJ08_06570 [Acidobacteria bacterium]|nr:MAG: hypothetical protein DRJ14_02250 [Acidobacteriota bacterium]RLE20733.1 MAG: hypothetical protein DRJ08_06570 [Acidobacteriota bacterium]
MPYVIFFTVVLIGILIGLMLRGKTAQQTDKRESDSFYMKSVRIIDSLQSGEGAGVENLLAAIMEEDSEKKEIYVIFGNVLREKGYIAEAIKVHKSVLHRPNLQDKFKGWALASLAEDFRLAGMLERAVRTYRDAFNLNPGDASLLKRYAHLCKQVSDYEKLLSLMDVMAKSKVLNDEKYRMEVAFVYNELGEQAMKNREFGKAETNFRKSLKLNSKVYPAYLNLARLSVEKGEKPNIAQKHLEELFRQVPDKAFLGMDLYLQISPHQFEELCHSLLNRNADDWRTRLHLSRYFVQQDRPDAAFPELIEAMKSMPHVLLIHQEIWKFLMQYPKRRDDLKQYAIQTDRIMVFNAPFMCVDCRYKSSEFLWKCPSCFGWNTFVESKI